MKTLLTLIIAAGLAGAALAQPASPAPTPEHQKMAVWYGDWTYTMELFATPVGPAAKVSGTMTGRPILNGLVAEFLMQEKGPDGNASYMEYCWYDPVAKGFAYVYVGEGYFEQGTFTMDGKVCLWEAKGLAGGQAFTMKGRETVGPGGQSLTRKAEVSVDGKKWMPYLEGVFTKVATPAH